MKQSVNWLVVGCALVFVAAFAWTHWPHPAPAGPTLAQQEAETNATYDEVHEAQNAVTVAGPLANYMAREGQAKVETLQPISHKATALDHVGGSVVGTSIGPHLPHRRDVVHLPRYHAMARQRPMSTKTGIPTSATFVFVNMLRKLRADFAPQYLAAVFDVAAPTFRDEQATAIVSTRTFDSKTQTYVDKAYDGYKANRVKMPDDLAQQVPYIRRALEAYRIPILEAPGFEADDVIGTLARKAADAATPCSSSPATRT
jgi:hypothetical protein